MKQYIKKGIALWVLLLIVVGCINKQPKQNQLTDFIPKNASVVVTISNWDDTKAAIASNDLLFPVLSKPFLSSVIQHINPATKSILCVSTSEKNTHYTLITKYHANLFVKDTIQFNKTNATIQKISWDDQAVFLMLKDSILVVSSSEKDILQSKNNQLLTENSFKKAYKIAGKGGLSIVGKATQIPVNDSVTYNFSDWVSMNTVVSSGSLVATGVAIPSDSLPQWVSVFKGQRPQPNEFTTITPLDVTEAISFTYHDYELLQENISVFNKASQVSHPAVFNLINEVAVLRFLNGRAIGIKSLDTDLTQEALSDYLSEPETYKDVKIFQFSNPTIFKESFFPLVHDTNYQYGFQLQSFFIFTSSKELAQQIITASVSENCMNKSPLFTSLSDDLSRSSSVMIVQNGNRVGTTLSHLLGIQPVSKKVLKQFPLGVMQMSIDNGFAHVNWVCKETHSGNSKTGNQVTEIASVTLENQLANPPVFFTNHITKGKDVVVQDVANNLYLLSSSGKILWKKPLDGKILGTVKEIDILKNGKKQLVFVTHNKLYVLDRNGKPVKPFPKTFKDEITQPLSVFDYDSNRKYRFVITQGRKITLFDSKGKPVKGFTFGNTQSPVVLSPVHIRIGTKDYILIAEQNGKLHILSRTGKSRISLSKTFDFSEMPIVKEGNNFVVISKGYKKHTISTKGRVVTKKLNISGTYYFTVLGKTKATLDDNLLRINGKLVELPYGIYTPPKIFTIRNNAYITLTDVQEKKVYVFTKYGKPVSGFPIYGMSVASLAYRKGKLWLVTQVDSNRISVYSGMVK